VPATCDKASKRLAESFRDLSRLRQAFTTRRLGPTDRKAFGGGAVTRQETSNATQLLTSALQYQFSIVFVLVSSVPVI
jgi:hypothetical protein